MAFNALRMRMRWDHQGSEDWQKREETRHALIPGTYNSRNKGVQEKPAKKTKKGAPRREIGSNLTAISVLVIFTCGAVYSSHCGKRDATSSLLKAMWEHGSYSDFWVSTYSHLSDSYQGFSKSPSITGLRLGPSLPSPLSMNTVQIMPLLLSQSPWLPVLYSAMSQTGISSYSVP